MNSFIKNIFQTFKFYTLTGFISCIVMFFLLLIILIFSGCAVFPMQVQRLHYESSYKLTCGGLIGRCFKKAEKICEGSYTITQQKVFDKTYVWKRLKPYKKSGTFPSTSYLKKEYEDRVVTDEIQYEELVMYIRCNKNN